MTDDGIGRLRTGTGPIEGPLPFFDAYPRFLETTRTGPSLDRLNARYTALIHQNREMIQGATVLDLASHDGRFSFAALQAGAKRVVGIDVDRDLIEAAHQNMAEYGVAPNRYEFVLRDMFRHFDDLDRFDVVFCFGIMYHVNDHMQLLSRIAGVEPRWLIIDTHVSQLEGAIVELRSPGGESPPPPGSALEGYPTRSALDAMLASFGWEVGYFDWDASWLSGVPGIGDYRTGRRVTAVVRCGDPVDPSVREHAVWLVGVLQKDRKHRWMTIRGVAEKCGVSPHALRTWVLEAEGGQPDR